RNWRADSAQAAGRAFQAQLDSVERAMQVRVDSALKAQRAQAFAAAAARARRWTECALRQFVDAGELPVSQGEMDACGQKPTMEELVAMSRCVGPVSADRRCPALSSTYLNPREPHSL